MKQEATTIVGNTPLPTTPTVAQKRWYRIAFVLWLIAVLVLATASVIVHFHPGPWPIDLQTTIYIQHHTWPVFYPFLNFISFLNDPIPSFIALGLWLLVLSLLRHFLEGLFIAFGTIIADALDGLLSTLVGRPRPHSPQIHIYIHEPFHSFPSGHTEHNMVYYGFLLYLSLGKPLRQWRYHWLLLPFQLFALVALVTIGYSRVFEGAHWITDVLAGYLSGAILLYALVACYLWAKRKLAQRQARAGHQREQGEHEDMLL